MADQQTIERIQQEVHTANQARAYEKGKQESINDLKTIISLQKDRIADLERKVEKYKLGYENLCVVINPSYDENKFNEIMAGK
jgi:predicted RNase H-like nuclease (RuvC/YqgF family)